MNNLPELERTIGYEFNNKDLITQAMTHSSYANTRHMAPHSDNERLEFLGDAVLEVVSSRFLYDKFPDYDEGSLSRLRASLVCEPTLAYCTEEIDLRKYILLSPGEEKTGGRKRNSIISDAMEALIGAIYLDGGIEPARNFIMKYILTDIEHKRLYHDSKTALQELIQAHHEKVTYEVIKEAGPDHAKEFEVEARVGERVIGRGSGSSKKQAEQEAAFRALKKLRNN